MYLIEIVYIKIVQPHSSLAADTCKIQTIQHVILDSKDNAVDIRVKEAIKKANWFLWARIQDGGYPMAMLSGNQVRAAINKDTLFGACGL